MLFASTRLDLQNLTIIRCHITGIILQEDLLLEEVSNCILKKCGGLPLAIMSIGSLLASKTNATKQGWQKVCDNLGSELPTNPTLEAAKQVLILATMICPTI
jgi:cobalamin biosynthesis protein CbiG